MFTTFATLGGPEAKVAPFLGMPGPGMFGLSPFFFTFCSFYSCTSYLNACSESFLIAILCLIGCGLGDLSPLCVGG